MPQPPIAPKPPSVHLKEETRKHQHEDDTGIQDFVVHPAVLVSGDRMSCSATHLSDLYAGL
eukprot:27075-Amorphochlora_amoeboformis.AAC.6